MSILGPRPTEPDAWLRWIREAAQLLARRPAAFGVFAAGTVAVLLVAHGVAWAPVRTLLTLPLTMLALTLFIRLALVADHNRDARLLYVLPGNLDAAVAATAAAGIYAVYGLLEPTLFSPLATSLEAVLTQAGLYEPRLASGAPAEPPQSSTLVGPVLIAGGLWGLATLGGVACLLAFGQWFLLPMVVLHGARPGLAMLVSVHAYSTNPVGMIGLLGVLLAAVAAVAMTLGWLGALLPPVFGVLLYTSYRDVFLARAHNHPAGPPVYTEVETLDQADEGGD